MAGINILNAEILDLELLKNQRLNPRDIERQYNELVKDAINFEKWSYDKLTRYAILFAIYLVNNGLNTSQIRKFLEQANRTSLKLRGIYKKESIDADIAKMRYMLHYATGRAERREANGISAFTRVLNLMLQKTNENNFNKFYDFLQAVVAYHKYFGGR
jgi:CRISPR-associated protein Csm2